MRRGSHDMQVNVAGIRRNIKNFAHNYSDAQKKVREATSNDPWGPSSTIMAEIADLTYNVVAFGEIMQMLWKRLNDHGRNWRHVYKALLLLEYLIKTGSEKVASQCRDHIFAIQTLKDFQYLEDGKDQGQNVREKAKQLVNLLNDDERLKNERTRALKAKERFAQSATGFGSDGGFETPTSPKYPAFRGDWNASRDAVDLPREIENARPQTAGEEELQLQLALAMSREEAEQEEQKRKSDDVRLQLALSQSQNDFKTTDKVKSHMVDLLDVTLGENAAPVDPWGMPQPPRSQTTSPWQRPNLGSPVGAASADPWAPASLAPKPDIWSGSETASAKPLPLLNETRHDPWSPTSQGSSTDMDDFDLIINRNKDSPTTNGNHNVNNNDDPFKLDLLGDSLPGSNGSTGAMKKTPHSFLGENSSLVNLDNLVPATKPIVTIPANPFSDQHPQKSLFSPSAPRPSINEMKQAPFVPFNSSSAGSGNSVPPAPLLPLSSTVNSAPFVSSSSTFSTNGLAFPAQPVQDPWAPVPSTNNSSQWLKNSEPANPFLS